MFADPVKNLKAFGIRENDIVADLGAGTGFYAVPAGRLANRGKVYAVEISKDHLSAIVDKAKDAHVPNVEIIWGDVEKKHGTKIKDNVADSVIVSNILFQLRDKETFIEEVKRILKSHGRVLLVDWSMSPVLGPNASKMAVSKNVAREMFEKKGFIFEREIDAGAHHYGIILKLKSVAP